MCAWPDGGGGLWESIPGQRPQDLSLLSSLGTEFPLTSFSPFPPSLSFPICPMGSLDLISEGPSQVQWPVTSLGSCPPVGTVPAESHGLVFSPWTGQAQVLGWSREPRLYPCDVTSPLSLRFLIYRKGLITHPGEG